jgi:hypothetical protein
MTFSSLCLGKKEKKSQKHPHSRSPIFNLFHWVSTVFPNALGNTVAVPLNILMKKILSSLLSPSSSPALSLSLSLSLSLLSLSLSPNKRNHRRKSQTKITDENRKRNRKPKSSFRWSVLPSGTRTDPGLLRTVTTPNPSPGLLRLQTQCVEDHGRSVVRDRLR